MINNDPYWGLFRLWSIEELDDEYRNQSTSDTISINDLVVKTGGGLSYVIGFDKERAVINDWDITDQFSRLTAETFGGTVQTQLIETSRLWIRGEVIQPLDSKHVNNKETSHYRIYQDAELTTCISVGSDTNDAVQIGGVGRLLRPLHEGDVVYLAWFDQAEYVLSIETLIVGNTYNTITDLEDPPIDIRINHPVVSDSDPRVIDLRSRPYLDDKDLTVDITYANRTVSVKLDGELTVLEGLDEAYYGDLPYAKVTLIHYLTADRSASISRPYHVFLSDVELPDIEPIPEPPRVDVYHTSHPYPVVTQGTDIIRSSARVNGELTVKRSVFSTSVIYPITLSAEIMGETLHAADGDLSFRTTHLGDSEALTETLIAPTGDLTFKTVVLNRAINSEVLTETLTSLTGDVVLKSVVINQASGDDLPGTAVSITGDLTIETVVINRDVNSETLPNTTVSPIFGDITLE